MNEWKTLHRFLQICMDIAEWHDRKGEEDHYWFGGELSNGIGLGYKAMTGYLRAGVKEVINLQSKYHHAEERRWLAESNEKEKIEFVLDIFGEEDPETLNDEIKERVKKAVKEIIAEWDKENGVPDEE